MSGERGGNCPSFAGVRGRMAPGLHLEPLSSADNSACRDPAWPLLSPTALYRLPRPSTDGPAVSTWGRARVGAVNLWATDWLDWIGVEFNAPPETI